MTEATRPPTEPTGGQRARPVPASWTRRTRAFRTRPVGRSPRPSRDGRRGRRHRRVSFLGVVGPHPVAATANHASHSSPTVERTPTACSAMATATMAARSRAKWARSPTAGGRDCARKDRWQKWRPDRRLGRGRAGSRLVGMIDADCPVVNALPAEVEQLRGPGGTGTVQADDHADSFTGSGSGTRRNHRHSVTS